MSDSSMSVRKDCFSILDVIGENPDADEDLVVEQLLRRGFERLRAELLLVFVPLGLARAVIQRLEATPPVRLSDVAVIYDSKRRM